MTIGMRDFVPELGRQPLLFRETFRTRAETLKNGAALFGTGTSFPGDGVTFDGNGNLSYTTLPGPAIFGSSVTFKVEFTVDFVPGDGLIHYFFRADNAAETAFYYVVVGTTGGLSMAFGATITLNIAIAAWVPLLLPSPQKNVLIVSSTTADTKVWVNGTLVGTSGVLWTAKRPTVMAVGARHTNATRWVGTIFSFEIYGSVSTAVDEPLLRAGNLVEGVDFSKSLAYLPGKTYYRRASDGLYVTDVGGKGTVSQALMGSDGSTVAQFPTVARGANLVRGFGFDGGDQINLGDSDLFSFTDGAVDKPFTLACLASQTLASTQLLIAKSNGVTAGEYQLGLNVNAGIVEVVFLLIDETSVAYIGRTGSLNVKLLGKLTPIVATCSGSGTVSGLRIYAGNIRVDTANTTFGVYARMRNTARTLRIGNDDSGVAPMRGSVVLPCVFDYESSPLQAKALGARLLWQSRRG